MNRIKARVAVLAGLLAMLAVPAAIAQTRTSLRVSIPFGFKAGKRDLPAGTYVFARDKSGQISLASAERTSTLLLPVITSLARSGEGDDHLLAFDKVGEDRILSEIWLPGQDGYLVNAQAGEHKHDIVRLVGKQK